MGDIWLSGNEWVTIGKMTECEWLSYELWTEWVDDSYNACDKVKLVGEWVSEVHLTYLVRESPINVVTSPKFMPILL